MKRIIIVLLAVFLIGGCAVPEPEMTESDSITFPSEEPTISYTEVTVEEPTDSPTEPPTEPPAEPPTEPTEQIGRAHV